MPERIGSRRLAVLKAAAEGHGLGDAVGQAVELELWQGDDGHYGVSFYWPVALPGGQKPLMQRPWARESQRYFHSTLVYELAEDGRAMKFVHDGQDCLVFEFLEEESQR